MNVGWQVLVGPPIGFTIGAIPFSYLLVRIFRRADLREVGTGTLGPANVYRASGFTLAFVAGLLEVGKGVAAAGVDGPGHRVWAAVSGGLAVTTHIWTPRLKRGGGRGLSTATGALFVVAWPAAVLLCAALVVGLALRHVMVVMGVGLSAVVPLLVWLMGLYVALCAAVVLVPVGVKTGVLLKRSRPWPLPWRRSEPGPGDGGDVGTHGDSAQP